MCLLLTHSYVKQDFLFITFGKLMSTQDVKLFWIVKKLIRKKNLTYISAVYFKIIKIVSGDIKSIPTTVRPTHYTHQYIHVFRYVFDLFSVIHVAIVSHQCEANKVYTHIWMNRICWRCTRWAHMYRYPQNP